MGKAPGRKHTHVIIEGTTTVATVTTWGHRRGIDGRPTATTETEGLHLTLRELQVLSLIEQGFKRTEIAHMLNCKLEAVKALIRDAKEKNSQDGGLLPRIKELVAAASSKGLLRESAIMQLQDLAWKDHPHKER